MRTLRLMIILLALGTFMEAEDEIYGADGNYKGYVEKDGSIYGNDGSYKGEVEDD